LVGTIHRDREAEPTLRRLLGQLRPELITLELSLHGLRFRRERGPVLRHRLYRHLRFLGPEALECPPIRDLLELLRLPFELRASLRYIQGEPEVVISCVDADGPSREYLHLLEVEALRRDNLRRLLQLPSGDGLVAAERRRALHALRRGRFLPPLDRERERLLAHEVRRLLLRLRPQRAVHIGGWQHLLPDWMYGRLRDLSPRRVLVLGSEVVEVGLQDQGRGHPVQEVPTAAGRGSRLAKGALGLEGGKPLIPELHRHFQGTP